MMQTWLADRGQTVPDATSTRHRMKMNGMEHDMLMPGMMTDEEMAALDRARGPEFDRLFLLGMIKHHQGAIDMVDVLFKAYGAAQDELVFKFASDVYADQSTEMPLHYSPQTAAKAILWTFTAATIGILLFIVLFVLRRGLPAESPRQHRHYLDTSHPAAVLTVTD